ncbi:hypothetical protein LWH94_09900 [Marinobacter sp. G11]|uniref:hypothetical protein n=1 Tax=Marinobacter sp. G11 TaxID=2903522 RepID=UPI001E61BC21|nr:hypothetical protein [Marinobacter sp. G11]MCE0759516.1 hypothetical protein [Marinobacter sp. G11]
MAEAIAVTNEQQSNRPEASPQAERQPYSRPVFRQKLVVNSLQAQRVMERSFDRVSSALFSLDVILRIIGDQEEIDQVEEIIQNHISATSEEMDNAMNQLRKIMADNGIDAVPGYSAPAEYTIEITSPQVAQIARLIRSLDELMSLVDTLWLNSILSSQQRSDATFQWQQRLIKLAGKIIGIEKRARISAHSKGKEKEVAEAAPEQETTDPELSRESESSDEENQTTKQKKAKDKEKETKAA